MSIEAAVVKTIAKVEVTDDYQVVLVTRKKRDTVLGLDDALQLADELVEAVESARGMLAEDEAARRPATFGSDAARAAWDVLGGAR